jgi:hypothetical protein
MSLYPDKKKATGPVKRVQVSVNSPEYKTAYAAGKIAKYDPRTETYTMQQMPEQTVSAKRISTRNPFEDVSFKKTALSAADVTTDLMQLGNFVPHPAAQAIGKIGSISGVAVDSYQAYDEFKKGNYKDAAINAGSAVIGGVLGSTAFKRNSKYLDPKSLFGRINNSGVSSSGNVKRVPYININGNVRGMSKNGLLKNRAALGALSAETIYDDNF